MPCIRPLGVVSTVWASMWASIQIKPSDPRDASARAAPFQVPMAQL